MALLIEMKPCCAVFSRIRSTSIHFNSFECEFVVSAPLILIATSLEFASESAKIAREACHDVSK